MKLHATKLPGVYVLQLDKLVDERGYFARAWCEREMRNFGLKTTYVQTNVGFSHQSGTLRGMHYQVAPQAEVKIVRCTRGAIYDVAIDLRPGSATLGQWVGVELTPENGLALYIPEQCAHGYQTLADNSEMSYQTSAFFSSAQCRAVRYNDSHFNIEWPLPVSSISDKDRDCADWSAAATTLVRS